MYCFAPFFLPKKATYIVMVTRQNIDAFEALRGITKPDKK